MIADNNKRLGAAVHELRDLIVRFFFRLDFPNQISISNPPFILPTIDPIKSRSGAIRGSRIVECRRRVGGRCTLEDTRPTSDERAGVRTAVNFNA